MTAPNEAALTRATAAEAKVAALTEALEAIRDSGLYTTGEGHAWCIKTARAALASNEGEVR